MFPAQSLFFASEIDHTRSLRNRERAEVTAQRVRRHRRHAAQRSTRSRGRSLSPTGATPVCD